MKTLAINPRPFGILRLALAASLLSGAVALHAAPKLAEVEQYSREQGVDAAAWLRRQDPADPDALMAALMTSRKEQLNYSLMQDGMRICRDAALYARAHDDRHLMQAAGTFANALLRKHATPSGAFVEYDRNTWLKPGAIWRTIPWGTAFCGNRAFEAWLVLKDEFTPAQREDWRREFEKTGAWIHRNPVVGGYVFNASVDLCGLLWRIGHEFGRPEWCAWALATMQLRIQRDVDDEGWIQAEDHGASGYYQLFGLEMLARFAWESKSPELADAVRRIFARSCVPFSTATMAWPGNFGTRVSKLKQLPGSVVLTAAALGDGQAAALLQEYGDPSWSADLELWRAALATKAEKPVYPAVQHFRGIDTTVVREGPWVAYFGNYDRSIWARGFMDLWHAGHGDWVFSTLNSMHLLSPTEKAKTRVSDVSDWAGFPHVRVTSGDHRQFDSHKCIESIEAKAGEGVTVTWSEPLLDEGGQAGGMMRSTYRFHGQEIELTIDLAGLVGESRLDFHLLRQPNGFMRLWAGEEAADIAAGRLLRTNGDFQDRVFPAGEKPLLAVQADRTTFVFETVALPTSAALSLIGETESGLHTGNLGGFRYRIVVPATEKTFTVKLRLRAVE